MFPTVEEELWKALYKARLILPDSNVSEAEAELHWGGCEYSKCGRTDKGVSAFGQVVGIRVRSNKPLHTPPKPATTKIAGESGIVEPMNSADNITARRNLDSTSDNRPHTPDSSTSSDETVLSFDPIHDELPYSKVLNRLLPPDIRVLAWCPNPPPNFSARFSCKERRYKYFFTNPAFSPTMGPALSMDPQNASITGSQRVGWLDINRMREAARKFEGLHDFRNFCKLDASKQIDNFERRIFHSDIAEVSSHEQPAGYMNNPTFSQYTSDSTEPHRQPMSQSISIDTPKLYAFTLHGSAFLWHQVRHMIAIIFLVGQGLEPPSLIDSLLDVQSNPCKPMYEMADDAPLVLWDCIFPTEGSDSREDALEWIYVGDDHGQENRSGRSTTGNAKFGTNGLIPDLWRVWRQRKIDEVLAGTLLNTAIGQGRRGGGIGARNCRESQKVFHGGDTYKPVGKYVPVLEKPRMESVEVINERYARKKGLDLKQSGLEDGNE